MSSVNLEVEVMRVDVAGGMVAGCVEDVLGVERGGIKGLWAIA